MGEQQAMSRYMEVVRERDALRSILGNNEEFLQLQKAVSDMYSFLLRADVDLLNQTESRGKLF